MWEIALTVVCIVISVTCFFVIQTLLTLQRNLNSLQRKVELLSDESLTTLRLTKAQLSSLDSIFRTIANVGDICETKTARLRANFIEKQSMASVEKPHIGEEIVQWALTSAHLYQQLFNKKE